MNNGKLDDGTPFVCIGANEPEAKEFIVHSKCKNCGQQHYFNLWKMLAGETIVCEHCGHESRAENRRRYLSSTGKWERYNEATGEWEEEHDEDLSD